MSDFWARRKEAVAREVAREAKAEEAIIAAQTEADLAERSDEELLAEANLPLPEDLDSAEAVRGFMNSALPNRLKTRALRQLWRLNPMLANLDGLVDYGEDFTDAATVIENLQTAYQVGKGMLQHIEHVAETKRLADEDAIAEEESALAESAEDPDEGAPQSETHHPMHPDMAGEDMAVSAVDTRGAPSDGVPQLPIEDPPSAPAPSRRMQFRFHEDQIA